MYVWRSADCDIAMNNEHSGTVILGKNTKPIEAYIADVVDELEKAYDVIEVIEETCGEGKAEYGDMHPTDAPNTKEGVSMEDAAWRGEMRRAYPSSFTDAKSIFHVVVPDLATFEHDGELPEKTVVEMLNWEHIDREWTVLRVEQEGELFVYKDWTINAKGNEQFKSKKRVVPAGALIREPNLLTGDGSAFGWFLRRKPGVGDGNPYNLKAKGDISEGNLENLSLSECRLIQQISRVFAVRDDQEEMVAKLWRGLMTDKGLPGSKSAQRFITYMKSLMRDAFDAVTDGEEVYEEYSFDYTNAKGEANTVTYRVSQTAKEVTDVLVGQTWSHFVSVAQIIEGVDKAKRDAAWQLLCDLVAQLANRNGKMLCTVEQLFQKIEGAALKCIDEIPVVARKINANGKLIPWDYSGFATEQGPNEYIGGVVIPRIVEVINSNIKFVDGRPAISPARDGKFYMKGALASYIHSFAWKAFAHQQWFASQILRNDFFVMTCARFLDNLARIWREENNEYGYVVAQIMADRTPTQFRDGFSERRAAIEDTNGLDG